MCSKQAKRKHAAMRQQQAAPKSNKKVSLKQVAARVKDAAHMLATGRIPRLK